MNRIQILILLFFLISNCSLNENSRIWNKKEEDTSLNQNQVKILDEKIKVQKEFNSSLKINLKDEFIKKNEDFNFYSSQKYKGQLNKVRNFKFWQT